MPQMMPLNWLILYFFFILIVMFINMNFYFIKFPSIQNKKISKIVNKINWKW